MSSELSNDNTRPIAPRQSPGAAVDPFSKAAFSSSHVSGERGALTKALINELTRCHEAIQKGDKIVAELPDLIHFKDAFDFQSALQFDPSSVPSTSSLNVALLKSRIAIRIQELATKGDAFYDTTQGNNAHLDRLKFQFETLKTKIVDVDHERTRCSEILDDVCTRVERVVESVARLPLRLDRETQLLSAMVLTLREYQRNGLGKSHIALTANNPAEVPLSKFFEELDGLTVGILYAVVRQA